MRKLIAIHLISVVCLAIFAIFSAIDISNSAQTGETRIDMSELQYCPSEQL